jgi:serine/threonine protein kinase
MVDQRRFSESRVKFYASQICLALGHLHKNKIIYRDLKPENIFLDSDGYIAMGDFGLSKVLNKEAFTFCGTPEYISPEIISEKGYSFETDWWSFGVFMYRDN